MSIRRGQDALFSKSPIMGGKQSGPPIVPGVKGEPKAGDATIPKQHPCCNPARGKWWHSFVANRHVSVLSEPALDS